MSKPENEKWLAYELHDRLMPWIHGARMQLANLQATSGGQQQLEVAKQCLAMAAEEGRSLIGFIESQAGEGQEALLEHAIRKFVAVCQSLAQQSQQSIKIAEPFQVGQDWGPSEAWCILRIIQQSVMNAIQHAGPCQIELKSSLIGKQAEFEVRDTGTGFDVENSPPGHFGLTSIRERAESIGAELLIESRPQQGTIVRLKVPCG